MKIKIFQNCIRGLSRKYRAYLYISALALFFIIGQVASYKVIPTWLNNTVQAMFTLLETVLELTFRDGLEYARRIIFNRRFVIESLYFEWFSEFWKQTKVTRGYVGTVRRLSKQCDTVFTQKLQDKIRWMRWRIIVMEKPVTTWPKVRAFFFSLFHVVTNPFDIGTPYEIMSFFLNKFISTTHDVHDKLHIITVSTTKFSNKIMALWRLNQIITVGHFPYVSYIYRKTYKRQILPWSRPHRSTLIKRIFVNTVTYV